MPTLDTTALFNFYPSSGYTPLTVDFTSVSVGTISSYLFNFGDGTTSTDSSTSHTYVVTTPTFFTPSLTVVGDDGTDSTSVLNGVHVLVPAPVANFTYAPHSGSSPLTVAFTNTSTGIISTNAWTFGDGTSSSSASPSHTYIDTVTVDQTATLTVTGPGGSDHTSAVVHIGGTSVPIITVNPTSQTVYAGDPLILSTTASGSGLSYSWTQNSASVTGSGSVYFRNTATTADAGVYQCTVSNAEGSAVSLTATVKVEDSLSLIKTMGRTETNKTGNLVLNKDGSVAFGNMASYPGN